MCLHYRQTLINAIAEFPRYFPFQIALAYVRSFVVEFFTLAETEFHFNPSFFEIEWKGNEGVSLLFHLAVDSFYLIMVEEEFLFALKILSVVYFFR